MPEAHLRLHRMQHVVILEQPDSRYHCPQRIGAILRLPRPAQERIFVPETKTLKGNQTYIEGWCSSHQATHIDTHHTTSAHGYSHVITRYQESSYYPCHHSHIWHSWQQKLHVGASSANIVLPILPVGCDYSNPATCPQTIHPGCLPWEEGQPEEGQLEAVQQKDGETEKGRPEDLQWWECKEQESQQPWKSDRPEQ